MWSFGIHDTSPSDRHLTGWEPWPQLAAAHGGPMLEVCSLLDYTLQELLIAENIPTHRPQQARIHMHATNKVHLST